MSNIDKKIYVKLTFRLLSPLALSSGENANSDKDALKDSLGRPYIPASSIAGVCKSLLYTEMDSDTRKKYLDHYLGYVRVRGKDVVPDDGDSDPDKKNQESASSRVLFYDGVISEPEPDQKYRIILRDGVGLNERKTAIKGAKFDIEAVEPGPEGLEFTTYLTQDLYPGDEDQTDRIIELFRSGQLSFGGKSMRGYGLTEFVECRKRVFSLLEPEDVQKWIEFDMYDMAAEWDVPESESENKIPSDQNRMLYRRLSLEITPRGAIMIRKYTTRPSTDKDHPEPDYEQLTIRENVPVIPGTSWAGAFRRRMQETGLTEKETADLFGCIKGKSGYRSKIRFSETRLKGAREKKLSRNAIDRFSGGAAEGALYTERTFYGGSGILDIAFTRDLTDRESAALAAAATDLHCGYLAVGGLTAVGRGVFTINKINDIPVKAGDKPEAVFDTIKKAVSAGLSEEGSK